MNEFTRAPRVLVVEDDEDIAQALQRSLRMEGYEVRAARDVRARALWSPVCGGWVRVCRWLASSATSTPEPRNLPWRLTIALLVVSYIKT